MAESLTRLLVDTSAVIAGVDAITLTGEDRAAISVITLGELRAGVLLAPRADARAARQARLAAVRAAFTPLPVDSTVAEAYGDILARAREQGRITKATDLLIVATAAASGRVLLTLDDSQARLARAVAVPVRARDGT